MSKEAILRLNQACIKQGDTVILDEVELLIKKGDFQYLIGSTGSGKSSLLKTLYGDLPLSSGSGHVCGINLVDLKEKQIPEL